MSVNTTVVVRLRPHISASNRRQHRVTCASTQRTAAVDEGSCSSWRLQRQMTAN